MTLWYCNNGDGLTTGYWAIAPWKRATSYPTGSIVRQRGGLITIGIALDFTHGKLWFKDLTNNGLWNDNATDDPGTNTGGVTNSVTGALFPAVDLLTFATATANFGASAFVGTLPSGFSSVNTANGSAVTWNPADCNANITLSGGNLIASGMGSASTDYLVRATASFTTGLVYWEVSFGWQTTGIFARSQSGSPDGVIGLANATLTLTTRLGSTVNGIGWFASQGTIFYNNATSATVHTIFPVTIGNERAYKNNGSTFTSGATQPAFPLGSAATVADGTGTWTEVTGTAANGWNACWARMEGLIAGGPPRMSFTTDIALVGDNHTQNNFGIATITIGGSGNQSYNFISVDHTIASPGVGNLLAGATLNFSNVISTIVGSFTLNGFSINNNGSGNAAITLANGVNQQRYENCTFQNNGSTSARYVLGATQPADIIDFVNCTMTSTVASTAPFRTGGARTTWRGGSITTGTTSNVFAGDQVAEVLFEGVDFTGVTGTFVPTGLNVSSSFRLSRCKLPNAGFLQATAVNQTGSETTWFECDNGTDQQSHGKTTPMGVQSDDRIVVRTGGASDGLANYSEKIVTSGNAVYLTPFRSLPIELWNSVTGANRTVTVYGIANAAAIPQTTDIWINAGYLGSGSSTLGSAKTTGPANLLVSGSNYSADTSAWDTGGVTARTNSETVAVGAIRKVSSNSGRVFFCTAITTGVLASSLPGGYASAVDGGSVTDGGATFRAGWRFTMAVTLSSPQPQLAGLISTIVEVAKASTTFYIDPQPVVS